MNSEVETLTVELQSLSNVFYLVLFISFSSNYLSLSLTFLSFAKHKLYLYRDNCFRDQCFPNGGAGKCIVQQMLLFAGSGLEAGQELLRLFWLADRAGYSDRTEILIQDVQSQAFMLQCLQRQDAAHPFQSLAFSPQLQPPPLNFIQEVISLVTQLLFPKYWEYSSRAKTFGAEYILREAQRGKK